MINKVGVEKCRESKCLYSCSISNIHRSGSRSRGKALAQRARRLRVLRERCRPPSHHREWLQVGRGSSGAFTRSFWELGSTWSTPGPHVTPPGPTRDSSCQGRAGAAPCWAVLGRAGLCWAVLGRAGPCLPGGPRAAVSQWKCVHQSGWGSTSVCIDKAVFCVGSAKLGLQPLLCLQLRAVTFLLVFASALWQGSFPADLAGAA